MNSHLGLFRKHELETNDYSSVASRFSGENISQGLEILLESIEGLNTVLESTTSFIVGSRLWRYEFEHSFEPIKELNFVPESITSGISPDADWFDSSPMVIITHLEWAQPPVTRWIQNLRHPSYQLRHPVPILVESTGDIVTATYDDVGLSGTGESVEDAIPDLCTKIVEYYEELQANDRQSQDYTFLKHIIEEMQSPAWEDFKQLYQEKLKELPYVQKGYINIDGKNADVVIILSEESVDLIKQLAKIDLDLNLQFRPLCFQVAYERSTDYLELDDFERFY